MENNEDVRPSLPKILYDKIEEDVVKLHIGLNLTIPVKPMEVSIDCGYNCFKRYMNWSMYSGKVKQYEKDLIAYYNNII